MEETCFSEIAKLSGKAATLHFFLFFFLFFFLSPGKSLSAPGQAKDKTPNKEFHSTMTMFCEQRHRLFPLPEPAHVTLSAVAGVRVLSLKLEEF